MEVTLKSKAYLKRILSHKISLLPDVPKQNLSFLTKVIPDFIFQHITKMGLQELKDFFHEKLVHFSKNDINDICFNMYNTINEPQTMDIRSSGMKPAYNSKLWNHELVPCFSGKITKLMWSAGWPHPNESADAVFAYNNIVGLTQNQSIVGTGSKLITEGMLYKIIESPVYILLQNDIGAMVEMCKNRNTMRTNWGWEESDRGSPSPTLSVIKENLKANKRDSTQPPMYQHSIKSPQPQNK